MNELDRHQRLHVVDMARRLRAGGIDRRGFMRAAGAAGFGFGCARYLAGGGAAGRATAAEQRAADAPLPPSGLTDDQRHFLRDVGRGFKGTRIRVISENTPPGVIIGRMRGRAMACAAPYRRFRSTPRRSRRLPHGFGSRCCAS